MKRREVIKKTGLGMASAIGLGQVPFNAFSLDIKKGYKQRKIYLFSKHLQWVGYEEMAKITSDIGFDGLDLTVRPKGHVEPANVERDLPKAIEACDKYGMKVKMMTTAIKSAADPNTDKILKTASGLGVKVYRMGWYRYEYSI